MSLEDRITIATPEGVDLDIALAGIGSRFMASSFDWLIKTAIVLAVAAGLGALGAVTDAGPPPGGDSSAWVGVALFGLIAFALFFGYDIAFEVLASGRTPGKRWTGLRVVRTGGQPVTLLPSTVRNLLRLVDGILFYAVGMICMLATERNQRLGDLAAGTIVIRERSGRRQAWAAAPLPAPDRALAAWDVSAVSVDEVATVRRFLERRHSLTDHARHRLGWELAQRLRPKVAGAADGQHDEVFLEQLVAAKSSRS